MGGFRGSHAVEGWACGDRALAPGPPWQGAHLLVPVTSVSGRPLSTGSRQHLVWVI